MPIFSPYHRISQVPEQSVADYLTAFFHQKGHPGAIRVDNGAPFRTPKANSTSALALWLIGHGVKVIWNPPASPKSNPKVERIQATSWRWSEISKAESYEQAQQRLDQAITTQREQYPVTRLGRKTRIEAFPELGQKARNWNPQNFDENRVYQFLAKKIYNRKVSSAGQITHFGHKLRIGAKWVRQTVQLKLEPEKLVWVVYDVQNKKTKEIPAFFLSRERILNLKVFRKKL